jgi:hypothetical protein
MRRYPILTCGVLLIAAASITADSHAQIVPPNGTYGGRTYPQWQVKYWQDLIATPVVNNRHPYLTPEAFGDQNGVVFLPDFPGAQVDLTVSTETALLLSIISFESSVFEPPPDHGDDEASMRANSNMRVDQQAASGFFAQIDGVPVDLTPFRFETPLFEWGPLPENNIFQFFGLTAPAGTTSLAVGAGYYLLLEPLSVGNHVLHFGHGMAGGAAATTYNVTVIPEPTSLIILGIAVVAGLVACRRSRQVGHTRPAQ